MPSPVLYDMKNNLKVVRKRIGIPLQDIAIMLDMKPPNLVRYENGMRNPTPEIILTYHILFGATLYDLFSPLVKTVKQNLLFRSQGLIEEYKTLQSPKSNNIISYMSDIVNQLKQDNGYESTTR